MILKSEMLHCRTDVVHYMFNTILFGFKMEHVRAGCIRGPEAEASRVVTSYANRKAPLQFCTIPPLALLHPAEQYGRRPARKKEKKRFLTSRLIERAAMTCGMMREMKDDHTSCCNIFHVHDTWTELLSL